MTSARAARRSRAPRRAPLRRRGLAAVVLAASVLGACGGGDDGTTPPVTSVGVTELTVATTAVAEPIRIMPLGDSITEGGDPTQPTTSPQSYRGYLYTMLTDAGFTVDFVGSNDRPAIAGDDPDNEGHGGFTIGPDESELCDGCGPANLDSGLEGWLQAGNPDIVLLMIGVNDLLPGETRPTVPEEAGEKLTALVGRIRTLAPEAVVVVASYPPISFLVDPALDNSAACTALNDAAAELGDGSDPNVLYAPMFETFEDSWTADDVLTEAGDNLHPSASGAKRIAGVWFDVLQPVLADWPTN
ncbi:MAG: GDSL-type esterase/lipase family protein [Acidimicrobiales bacterium]